MPEPPLGKTTARVGALTDVGGAVNPPDSFGPAVGCAAGLVASSRLIRAIRLTMGLALALELVWSALLSPVFGWFVLEALADGLALGLALALPPGTKLGVAWFPDPDAGVHEPAPEEGVPEPLPEPSGRGEKPPPDPAGA